MKPLDPLSGLGELESLLSSASVGLVRAELVRLEDSTLDDHGVVALLYARAELALRLRAYDEAHGFLLHAATGYRDLGEREAEELARAHGHLAVAMRGPRAASLEAAVELERLASAASTERVKATCDHGRGVARRATGELLLAHEAWTSALSGSEEMPDLRARVLLELGELYLSVGAIGGATSLLVRSAELARRLDHAIIEQRAHQSLARAASHRGDLAAARRHWLRCEVVADALEDLTARVEALSALAEIATQWERHGDALELSRTALALAEGQEPAQPSMLAWASRALGRATMELGDEEAAAHVARAREAFEELGDKLGEALARWDEAALAERARPSGVGVGWFEAGWMLATLGDSRRVLDLLADRRESRGGAESPEPHDVARLALAERFSSHADGVEAELLADQPARLIALSQERADAHRNAARLCVLSAAPAGLVVAAIAAPPIGVARHAYPPATAAAVLVGQLPGVCVWAWRPPHHGLLIARDLAAVRAALGAQVRVVVARYAAARVVSPGFGAGASARLEGADAAALCFAALAAAPGALVLREPSDPEDALDWDAECDVLVKMAGLTLTR